MITVPFALCFEAFSDNLCRTLRSALSAVHALLVVDFGQEVRDMDGIVFTLFYAEIAADTSRAANLLNSRSLVVAGAADRILAVVGQKLDQMFRTGDHAFAAGLTGVPVDSCNTVDNVNGVKRAGFHTGTEPEAAEGTAFIGKT